LRQIALTAAREGAGGDPSASARFVVVVSFRVCFVSFCFLPFSSPHVPRAHSSCPLGRGVLMHIPGCDFLRGASLAPALPSPLCLCSVLDAAEAYSGMRILAGGTPRAAFVGLCYSYIYIVNTVHFRRVSRLPFPRSLSRAMTKATGNSRRSANSKAKKDAKAGAYGEASFVPFQFRSQRGGFFPVLFLRCVALIRNRSHPQVCGPAPRSGGLGERGGAARPQGAGR